MVLDLTGDAPPSDSDLDEIFKQHQPPKTPVATAPEKTSMAGAVARGAGSSVLPSAAAAEAFLPASLLGGGPESPFGIATGIIGSGVAAFAASKAQHKIAEAIAPEPTKRFDELSEQAQLNHPVMKSVGELIGGLGSFEANSPKDLINGLKGLSKIAARKTVTKAETKSATALATQIALGTATGVATPLVQGQSPTKGDLLESVAGMLFLGNKRFKTFEPAEKGSAVVPPPADPAAKGKDTTAPGKESTMPNGIVEPPPSEEYVAPTNPKKPNTHRIEQDESGKYVVIDQDDNVVGEAHSKFNDAKLAVDALKTSRGKKPSAPEAEDPLETVSKISNMGADEFFKNYQSFNKMNDDLGKKLANPKGIAALHEAWNKAKSDLSAAMEAFKKDPSAENDRTLGILSSKPQLFREALDNALGIHESKGKTTSAQYENLFQATLKEALQPKPEPPKLSASISAEDHAQLKKISDETGVGYRVEENLDDQKNPFARGGSKEGHLATIDPKTGEIVINGPEFSKYADLAGSEKRKLVTTSVAMEEIRHLATDPASAGPYWQSLSKVQQYVAHQRYNRGDPRGMSPQMLGYEAINFDMARLAGETDHQILTSDYFDRMSLKSLKILDTVIRGIQTVLARIPINATKGIRERIKLQNNILNEVRRKLDLLQAKRSVKPNAKDAPSSISRNAQKLALQHADDMEKAADEWEKNGGTKAEADDMRAQARELRQQTFDDSFRPSAVPRTRKEVEIRDVGQYWMDRHGVSDKASGGHESFARTLMERAGLDLKSRNPYSWMNEKGYIRYHISYTGVSGEKSMFFSGPATDKQISELKNIAEHNNIPLTRETARGDQVLFTPLQQPSAQGRGRPKKRNESVFQEKFLLPGEETKKTAEGNVLQSGAETAGLPTQQVAGDDRKSAESAGALPRLNAVQLGEEASKYLSDKFDKIKDSSETGEKESLNFSDFVDFMKGRQSSLQDGHLVEMWQDAIAKKLETADDEDLRGLARSVLVRGASKITDKEIAEAKREGLSGSRGQEGKSSAIWSRMLAKPLTYVKTTAEERAKDLQDFIHAYDSKHEADLISTEDEISARNQNREDAIKRFKLDNAASERQAAKDERDTKRRRQVLVGAIYKRLVVPRLEEADVTRKDISVDDIRFGGGDLISAVQPIAPGSERDIPALTRELIDNSKRLNSDPTTYTKRLTLVQDKSSGKVHLVSTYRRGDDAMLLDPIHPKGHHLPLQDMIGRYRILQSILLDEPVQKFRKSWDSVSDYLNDFGNEAAKINENATSGTGAIGEEGDQFIGGKRVTHGAGTSEGIPGSGIEEGGDQGHLQGPFKDAMVESGETAMDRARRTPLTDLEGQALEDHITDHLGHPAASPSEVLTALYQMADTRPKTPVVSAMRKIAAMYEKRWPDLSVGELLNRMAIGIYGDKTLEKHIAGSQESTAQKAGKPLGYQGKASTGKELTLPIKRRPPTDVAGAEPGTGRDPTHAMPGPSKPEMLEGKDLEWVKSMLNDPRYKSELAKDVESRTQKQSREAEKLTEADREWVRRMTTDPETGSKVRLQHINQGEVIHTSIPSAMNRSSLKAALGEERDKFLAGASVFWGSAGTTLKRVDNSKDMASSYDAAATLANVGGRQAGMAVRLNSASKSMKQGNKELLAGARAYYSTGAVKVRYKLSAESIAESERLVAQEKEFIDRQNFINSREADLAKYMEQEHNSKNSRDRRAEFSKMISKAKQELELAHTELNRNLNKRLLETGFLSHTDATYYHDDRAKDNLDQLSFRVRQGIEAANRMLKNGGVWERHVAKKWIKSNEGLLAELEFAKVHWDNIELRQTAESTKKELDHIYDLKRKHGVQLDYSEDYLPGRYDGDLVTRDRVFLGPKNILGGKSSATKSFPTYYHAAQAGPYIPASNDIASLVESSVRQGLGSVNKQLWWDQLKTMKDEGSGMLISMPGKDSYGKTTAPTPDYVAFRTPSGGTAYILKTYEGLIHQLVDPSAVTNWAVSRAALNAGQFLKHTVLLGDVFHLSRLMYYSLAVSGVKANARTGFAALEMREKDIPRAVEKGIIDKSIATWLNEKLPFFENGQTSTITRHGLSSLFQRSGLNVGQIQDALYKDLVKEVPVFGAYNKWLFGRFTRGLMLDAAVNEYARLGKLDPQKDSSQVVREIAKDLNFFYGSIGRQGWIKSATFRDLSRMILLAPQWQEGLIKKESSLLRGFTSPRRALTGRDTSFRAMARGMLSMFVMAQVLNMMIRRQPTWDNKEPDHKWDADIGLGMWLSPLAVFNELTADLVRYNETKPKVFDAIQQVGENKLGFMGRMAMVMATGKSPSGTVPSTTAGVLGTIASQAAPSPISFGPAIRGISHAIAPSLVDPNRPGRLLQSAYSSSGLKTHRGLDAEQMVRLSAAKFRKEHGIQVPTMEYSDEPSYSELRYNLKNGNEAGARKILEGLLKTKTKQQISVALHNFSRMLFTGSIAGERLWIHGMTPDERQVYNEGLKQRRDDSLKAERWFHEVIQPQ